MSGDTSSPFGAREPTGFPFWDAALLPGNLAAAMERCQANAGAPGVDKMSVGELPTHLRKHWPEIRAAILDGRWEPQPVRRVRIPKPNGKGERILGIPCVVDRFIQHAVAQALSPLVDPRFSAFSYAYRPGRHARDAVRQAQKYIEASQAWIVDLDIEKFFDHIDHEHVLARLNSWVPDPPLQTLVRAWLKAGAVDNGVFEPTQEGAPQGGPLSPLLANITLDELDQSLAKERHRFVRYADDLLTFHESETEAQNALDWMTEYLRSVLRLDINAEKSRVARPNDVAFLGFSFELNEQGRALRVVSEQSIERFHDKVAEILAADRKNAIEEVLKRLGQFVDGWTTYYQYAEAPGVVGHLRADARAKARGFIWDRWKTPRQRAREMIQLGVTKETARAFAQQTLTPDQAASAGALRQALSNAYFRKWNLGEPDTIPSKAKSTSSQVAPENLPETKEAITRKRRPLGIRFELRFEVGIHPLFLFQCRIPAPNRHELKP